MIPRTVPWLLLAACAGRGKAPLPAVSATAAAPSLASGLYEGFSPITMAPYGPLDEATTKKLPRWLDVRVDGETVDVIERPEDRIRWRLRYGEHGLVSKRVTVDGEFWLESRFARDGEGRLLDKEVSGPGSDRRLSFAYTVDERGRVTERRRRDGGETWRVAHDQEGGTTVATTIWDGKIARVDRFDAAGRLLRTDLGEPKHAATWHVAVVYDRDAGGRLRNVIRRRGGGPTVFAAFDRPDQSLVAGDLIPIFPVVERHEVLLALGAPMTHSDDGKGVARRSRDAFGTDCWLNAASAIVYDAAGRAHGTEVTCICGFCVDAALDAAAGDGAEVVGRDWHWTAGPWVRFDGSVDVTADHEVLTPNGPRAAGELAAGDLVLGEDGAPRALRSVERLPEGELRLGVNLRTTTDRFQAGGLLFGSEHGRACGP